MVLLCHPKLRYLQTLFRAIYWLHPFDLTDTIVEHIVQLKLRLTWKVDCPSIVYS